MVYTCKQCIIYNRRWRCRRHLGIHFVLKFFFFQTSITMSNGMEYYYTSIPHSKLKDKLKELVLLYFVKQNGQRRYKYLVLGRNKSYFVKDHSDSNKKFSESDIIKMLDFLIDNIFVTFGGRVFNRLSAFQWEQTVPLYLPTCFFIIMRLTSCRNFLGRKIRS